MTAEKWETTTGIGGMLNVPAVAADARKVRLFGVACCRQMSAWADSPAVAKALTVAERFADGRASRSDLLTRYQSLTRRYTAILRTPEGRSSRTGRAETTYLLACLGVTAPDDPLAVRYTVDRLAGGRDEFGAKAVSGLRKRFANLLRCVFGNPFRPVAFSPTWLTDTVTTLAASIYADRAFDRLPVLADALEEAGCDNSDVLAHCRGDGPHARGCWVVDGVLRKG